MVNALFVLLIDCLEDVVDGLGAVDLVGVLLSSEQTQIQAEFHDVIAVCVKDEAVDLGDLHDLFVCSAVGNSLQNLAFGCPMGIEALLGEDDPSSFTVIEILILIKHLCKHFKILELLYYIFILHILNSMPT